MKTVCSFLFYRTNIELMGKCNNSRASIEKSKKNNVYKKHTDCQGMKVIELRRKKQLRIMYASLMTGLFNDFNNNDGL